MLTPARLPKRSPRRLRKFYAIIVKVFTPARVAKLADARDLKSRVPKGTYRFDSGPGHQARGSIFRRLFRDVTLTLMFSIRIDDLTFEHVNDFCQARPREGLTLDYKLNFPRRLEKTIASFANTYGGHILIGVDETATGEPVLPISGVPLEQGLRERVVAIGLDAISPPVYPVRVIKFQSPDATNADRALIVIRV